MPESALSLLDTKSSSKQKTLRTSYRETMLQSCEDDPLAIDYIYGTLDEKNDTEKLDRLHSCRTGAFFYRNKDTGRIRIAAQSCHLRFCPLCSKSKMLTIKTNATRWMLSARFPKLLTFTLKHNDNKLTDQIDKLYNSFQEIRRLSILKKKCCGGIWFFQIKKSKTDNRWHPHIHCLIGGNYIPLSELKQKWFHITGDSKQVDIRMVKSKETAARHVARYAAKPCSFNKLHLDECLELAEALESRRICGTWGECRKLKLTSPPEYQKESWYRIASWRTVFECRNHDDNAKAILDAWRKGVPLEKGIHMDHLFAEDEPTVSSKNKASPMLENQSWFEWRYSK